MLSLSIYIRFPGDSFVTGDRNMINVHKSRVKRSDESSKLSLSCDMSHNPGVDVWVIAHLV